MDLDAIILSEVSQRKTDITGHYLFVAYKNDRWTYLQNRNRFA